MSWGQNSFATQNLTRKQIESLRKNGGVITLVPDESFEIPFQAGPNSFSIIVSLPARFPEFPPIVRFQKPVVHRWVDSNGNVVGHEQLGFGRWGPHSDLGRIIAEVVAEMKAHPPQPAAAPADRAQGAPQFSSGYGHSYKVDHFQRPPGGGAVAQQQPAPRREEHTVLPPVPEVFNELDGLDKATLITLLNDTESYEAFFNKLECVQTHRKLRDDLIEQNAVLSKENLAIRDQNEETKSHLADQEEAVRLLKKDFDEKAQRQKALLDKYSPAALAAKLRDARDQAESESESIAEGFLDGSVLFDDFVERFVAVRRLFHERNTKLTRMAQGR